jgi:hypothetical protein
LYALHHYEKSVLDCDVLCEDIKREFARRENIRRRADARAFVRVFAARKMCPMLASVIARELFAPIE